MNYAMEKGKIEVARNMLAKGTATNFIAKVTGLTIEEIEKLKQR